MGVPKNPTRIQVPLLAQASMGAPRLGSMMESFAFLGGEKFMPMVSTLLPLTGSMIERGLCPDAFGSSNSRFGCSNEMGCPFLGSLMAITFRSGV
mmetsp:Transcript_1376/g.4362  ORF Transcript_1376/g.4362 Transcript_1376/m.4362 type:complete len:95 (+) Transcript_1376:126-410(+)